MPQASGRIIHGNLRPKDNDERINKDWITQPLMNSWGSNHGLDYHIRS